MELLEIIEVSSVEELDADMYKARIFRDAVFSHKETNHRADMHVEEEEGGIVANISLPDLIANIPASAKMLFEKEMEKEFGPGWVLQELHHKYKILK